MIGLTQTLLPLRWRIHWLQDRRPPRNSLLKVCIFLVLLLPACLRAPLFGYPAIRALELRPTPSTCSSAPVVKVASNANKRTAFTMSFDVPKRFRTLRLRMLR